MGKIINFNGTDCVLEFGKYTNEVTAIQLIEKDTGFPFATATVNFPDKLELDEIAIKNWSENYGILEVLLENDIITPPHRFIWSGYVKVPVCKLKDDGNG
jgi:hypothetical protein